MKAIWNNTVIAESNETVSIEGNVYFPPSALIREFAVESSYHTTCPWKGIASYYSLEVEGKKNENAVWYYPSPKKGSVEKVGKDFTNYVAFWNGVVVE